MNWLRISLVLCLFGFLKEIRPSEPFVYEFLIGPWRNVTEAQVNQEVYPVGTYGYLAQLVVVFLITDMCRYKPLIIVLGISGIIVWSMLLWTTSLLCLQILELIYGTFMAAEVAYYTYIYAKVDPQYFQLVTSHTRAAILAGRTISGVLGQLLISFDVMDYRQLNYITFSAMIAATLWSFLLPSVQTSIYFHRHDSSDEHNLFKKALKAFSLMGAHFVQTFSHSYVIKWSIWWSLATCGFIQVQTYMQPLWTAIVDDKSQPIYNGAVEAVLTVLGFLGALLAGVLRVNWQVKGDLLLSFGSLILGFIMVISSHTQYVYVSYVCYVAFGALYHFMITVASAEIAKHILEDSYGLVFGFTTLMAMLCQTVLTIIVVADYTKLGLSIRTQYFIYGCYHIVLAVFYIIIGFINWIRSKKELKGTAL